MTPDTPAIAEENRTNEPLISIRAEALPVVNYALQQNRLPMLQSLMLVNEGEELLREAELTIVSEPAFCAPVRRTVDLIPAKSSVDLTRDVKLQLDGKELACLTEKVTGTLTFTLAKEGETLAETVLDVSVLAFDEWPGYGIYPELVAAFANPNHPAIAGILTRAASLLEQWTGDPSIVGYQRKDPDWVLKQAAAIYVALQQQNIVYSVLPASFEKMGQRLRLGDVVLEQKMGNCIELTLLYAACLEACSLHPLVIFKPGHAFLGLWLEDLTFQEAVQYDPSLLTKRLLQTFGIGRSSAKISAHLAAIYRAMGLERTEQEGQSICWREGQSPEGCDLFRASGEGESKREIRDLPVQEAANAVCYVLLDQISMLQSYLLKESARLLGYQRMTANVTAAFTNAVGYALARGWLELSGDRIWKLSDAGTERAQRLEEQVELVTVEE